MAVEADWKLHWCNKKGGKKEMNLEAITLEDCIRRFMLEGAETIIKAGHVVGFSCSRKERNLDFEE